MGASGCVGVGVGVKMRGDAGMRAPVMVWPGGSSWADDHRPFTRPLCVVGLFSAPFLPPCLSLSFLPLPTPLFFHFQIIGAIASKLLNANTASRVDNILPSGATGSVDLY
jgi:hypothetical protein